MSDIEATRVNELAEILPVHVMRLGNLSTGLSSTAWTKISNDILEAATLLRALTEAQERAERAEEALANLADCQPLPKVYKYTGTAEVDVENMFDVGHRHRSGKQPRDYLMSWLSMFRPFAYATKDDSWGELEKLISITMNNYVQILVKAEKARAALGETK